MLWLILCIIISIANAQSCETLGYPDEASCQKSFETPTYNKEKAKFCQELQKKCCAKTCAGASKPVTSASGDSTLTTKMQTVMKDFVERGMLVHALDYPGSTVRKADSIFKFWTTEMGGTGYNGYLNLFSTFFTTIIPGKKSWSMNDEDKKPAKAEDSGAFFVKSRSRCGMVIDPLAYPDVSIQLMGSADVWLTNIGGQTSKVDKFDELCAYQADQLKSHNPGREGSTMCDETATRKAENCRLRLVLAGMSMSGDHMRQETRADQEKKGIQLAKCYDKDVNHEAIVPDKPPFMELATLKKVPMYDSKKKEEVQAALEKVVEVSKGALRGNEIVIAANLKNGLKAILWWSDNYTKTEGKKKWEIDESIASPEEAEKIIQLQHDYLCEAANKWLSEVKVEPIPCVKINEDLTEASLFNSGLSVKTKIDLKNDYKVIEESSPQAAPQKKVSASNQLSQFTNFQKVMFFLLLFLVSTAAYGWRTETKATNFYNKSLFDKP